MDRLTMLRIVLEVVLLISGVLILTAGIILLLRKTGIMKESGNTG
jgi:hypothetical protein